MANAILTKGTRVFVSAVAQPDDLTQLEFEALTWVEVCCPTTAPAFASEAEVVSEFCISGKEQVATGASSGMETEMAVFYISDCEGQDIMRNAYEGSARAFKKVYSDGTDTETGTTIYTRALVTSQPDGDAGVNEFVTHTYAMKIVQPPILVKPEAI